MKRITPERNVYGYIDSYTVSDVSEREIQINGTVSEWYLKISTLFYVLIFLPPLFILLSPILYFVSKNILKKGGEFKNRKMFIVVNKITLGITVYWIVCLIIMLICGIVYLLHYFGIIEVQFADKLIELINL